MCIPFHIFPRMIYFLFTYLFIYLFLLQVKHKGEKKITLIRLGEKNYMK